LKHALLHIIIHDWESNQLNMYYCISLYLTGGKQSIKHVLLHTVIPDWENNQWNMYYCISLYM